MDKDRDTKRAERQFLQDLIDKFATDPDIDVYVGQRGKRPRQDKQKIDGSTPAGIGQP